MALPPQRDPEVTAKQLTEWLGSRLPAGADVVISNLEIPRTGFSNETFYFDADWTDYDGRHHERLVTRVQPGDHQLFLGADVGTQFRTQVALGSHSPVPLPKMFWHEADPGVLGRAFYVMGRIDGRVPLVLPSYHSGGWVTDLEPAQRELMWQNAMAALVQIAQADARTGFEFLLEDGKQPGLDSYLDWVKSWQEWAVRRRTFPILDAGLEYVLANKPEDDSVSVVWGDAVSTMP